jgi:hypothetical protein
MNELLSMIVLAGAALGVLSKWVFLPLVHAIRTGYRALMFIQHEVTENSGRSMKDGLDRMDHRMEYLFDHLGIDMPEHLRTPAPNKES